MKVKEKIMTKSQWQEFYEYLLEKGVATIETLQKKYDEYDKYKLLLLNNPNARNYMNGQDALEEILQKEKELESEDIEL